MLISKDVCETHLKNVNVVLVLIAAAMATAPVGPMRFESKLFA